MSVITRGVKNAFRSGIRTTAVVLILAISMGLALSMLLANQAVKDRLEDVKKSVGTTIMVNPAGSEGFQGGGEPLTGADVTKLQNVDHVSDVTATLSLMLTTNVEEDENSNMQFKAFGGSGLESGETNLESSVDPGTIGNRLQGRGEVSVDSSGDASDIKLPIRLTGTNGDKDEQGKTINVTDGRQLQGSDTNAALVGKSLAEKNNLSVGSTFTAYDETFTVVGIFDTGTDFGNDGLYIPLATAQRVSEADTEISAAVVTVDSVDNVEPTVANIKTALGDAADVTTSEEHALTAVESLRSVEKVSIVGFVIALAAAGVIIFLTMLMIVRERRREIGVLKAIGASNRTIVSQFMVEAILLVAISAVLGFAVAAASSNSIAGALVSSNTASSNEETANAPQGPGNFRSVQINGGDSLNSATDLIGNVTTNVDLKTLGYGLLAAVAIAIIGSAIPAWFITKVRPAEVLRGE